MEIIKAGDFSRLKHIKEFECNDCGCVFKACDSEYGFAGWRRGIAECVCKCPTCGAPVFTEE